MAKRIAIVGGGAAGYFAAIAAAEADASLSITIFEGTRRPLTKVRISGGGRCNVTHACFEPRDLVRGYPRGHKELLGPFSRFQPKDTVAWFERRGVPLKAEPDGRMFPTTDDSETIAGCLERSAGAAGVDVRLGEIVKGVRVDGGAFRLALRSGEESFDKLLLATGSGPQGHAFAARLGHVLTPPVPSLFTFNVVDPRLLDLGGVSFPDAGLELVVEGQAQAFAQRGPLLITHWGLSGPAVLKLSAWAARELHDSRYRARLRVRLHAALSLADVEAALKQFKTEHARKDVSTVAPMNVPKRYWQRLVELRTPAASKWADLGKAALADLAHEIAGALFQVDGKGVFKDEFVTAGGVSLADVDFRTLESRKIPGLYFAGEILDIDGITGGFNFQAAWTTGWLAGRAMAASLGSPAVEP